MDTASAEPIKVEVVNFDNIRDNTVKVVVAAVAMTVATKLVEASIDVYISRRRQRKMQEQIAKRPNN